MTKLLTPSELPDETVCRTIKVPNSLEWLGIFNAVLLAGTYPYNWSDDIDTHVSREQAAEWYTAIFNEYLTADMVCCSDAPSYRLNDAGEYQYSYDGGETWTTDAQPMGAPEPRTEPTDDEKKCAAAANAAYVYRLLYEQSVEYYNDNVEPALALTSLVSGVMLGYFFPPAVPFVEAIFGIAYSVLEYFTSGQFSDEVQSDFMCLLLDEANVDGAGIVTFEFEDVRTLVNGKMFENPVWIAISYFLNTFGSDALNRAGASTAIVDEDCAECGDTWCYEWDFTVDAGNWGVYAGVVGSLTPLGFETGIAYAGGDPSRGRRFTIVDFQGFPTDAQLTRIDMFFDNTIGNISASSGLGIYANNLATNLSPEETPTNGLVEAVYEGSVTGLSSLQVINGVGGCDGCGDPGGVGYAYKVQLRGTGELPSEFFGGTECE